MVRITVVIPTFNRSGYLAEALETVKSQTVPPHEVIVVDDGSTDDTPEVVKRYRPLKYIRQENAGPSAARNRGIREANGDVIAFLDADDLWFPRKIELQVIPFERETQIGLVVSAHCVCDREGNLIQINNAYHPKRVSLCRELAYHNVFSTSAVMVRKEGLLRAGGFNESYRFGEDWDMWRRLVEAFPVRYLEEPLSIYRSLADDSISSRDNSSNFADWERIIADSRKRSHGFTGKVVDYLKATSWYYFYRSYVEQVGRNRERERSYLAKSIAVWPFFVYKRYLALVRTMVDERWYEIYRRMRRSGA